jgi:hypothetical protein
MSSPAVDHTSHLGVVLPTGSSEVIQDAVPSAVVPMMEIPNASNPEVSCEQSHGEGHKIAYLQGFRFLLLSITLVFLFLLSALRLRFNTLLTLKFYRLALMLFLVSIDVTITTTSVVAITEELGGFSTASWILSSYQLGWVGKFTK